MGFLLVVADLQDQILNSKSFYISPVVSYLIFVLILGQHVHEILVLFLKIFGYESRCEHKLSPSTPSNNVMFVDFFSVI